MWTYNPLLNIPPGSAEADLVLGGEVNMWSELTDPANIDSKVWPRASAVAEVLWSGPRDNGSFVDAATRLAEFRERMLVRGVNAAVVQTTFCTQEGAEACSI